MRVIRLLRRSAARIALPEGSLAVAGGLVAAGLFTYAFLAVSARALGPERYAALSGLWGLVFLLAPGLFGPFEQEVGRALAARRVHGVGGFSVVTRSATLALGVLAVLLLVTGLLQGVLLKELFDGSALLFVAFVLAMVGFAGGNITKGALAGTGSFGRYGAILAAEGGVRLLAAALLAIFGIGMAGPYGLVVGVSPFIAFAFARGRRELFEPGPPAEWAELSANLGYLFVGAVCASALVYAGPVAAKLLATDAETARAGKFLATVVVARVPLFLFQAIQIALLPKLSRLAAAGRAQEFLNGLRRLLVVVVMLGVGSTAVATTAGPWVIGTLFGADFVLGSLHLALLGLSTTAYMIALTFAQGLIAYGAHRRAAVGWFVGVAFLVASLVLGGELLMRIERSLLAGAFAAAVAMAFALAGATSRDRQTAGSSSALEPVVNEP